MHHCVGWLQELGVGKYHLGCCHSQGLLLTGRASLLYVRLKTWWLLIPARFGSPCLLVRFVAARLLSSRWASFHRTISILLLRAHRSEALCFPAMLFRLQIYTTASEIAVATPFETVDICYMSLVLPADWNRYCLDLSKAAAMTAIWDEENVLRSSNMLHWLLNKDGDVKNCPFD
jgi:hypothetical protein